METKKKNDFNNDNPEVQDIAFLVVSEDRIGVTGSLADVSAMLASGAEDPAQFHIFRGSKQDMLSMEYKIQLHDAVDAVNLAGVDKGSRFLIPEQNVDYNLCEREPRHSEGLGLRPIFRRF